MAHVSYTNRKGQTFYLHQRRNRAGGLCYRFMKEPGDGVLSKIPEGYEIVEGIHGVVSIRKVKPRLIQDSELRLVRHVLDKHPHLHRCRTADKGKTIEVYEPRKTSLPEHGNDMQFWPLRTPEKLADYERRNMVYDPTMRFVLVNRKTRLFRVERMCYHSWHDGWKSLDKVGPLQDLAEEFLPHLTRPSFYELWNW